MIYSLCDFFRHDKEIAPQKINLEQHINILTIIKAAN